MVADCRLVDTTDHFMPIRIYRGYGRWMWMTRKEYWQVTGRGDYVLSTNRHKSFNAGGREAQLHTDHIMVLVVISE